MTNKQKKKIFQLQLNEIKKTDDPTKLPCTFIIFDFETSHNNTVISKEVALDASPTIINKPIVAKYHEVEGINTATDALGSHEAYLGTDKHGELEVKTDTTPIGVFTSEGYIMEIDTAEGKKEVLAADAVLWSSRFSDACELLLEWYSRGININTSCEILYSNYSVKDGIEYIEAPIYLEGHAILNSEKRGEHDIVLHGYDSLRLVIFNAMKKFEKLVAQAANQEKQKEGEKVDKFKKVFELSHSDIRALIYNQLDPTLESNEESYIADVYDTYFIVNIYSWSEDNSYDKYYKINYAKNGDTLTIDFDSKIEVFLKRNWEEVVPEEIQSQLNEKDTTISKLSEQFNEIKEKFNTASEKLVQLNSALEELKPFKEQHEKAEFEKRVQEKKEFYKSKFEALNAEEKFETEEVQNLILASAKDSEETDKAILQLNSMLVDLVDHEADQDEVFIRELSSKREKLLKEDDSFESRYSS